MRSVSARFWRVSALAAFVVILVIPGAYADDGNPYEPLEARIRPPGGAPSADPDDTSTDARIQPPVGATDDETNDARFGPPGGVRADTAKAAPFWMWLISWFSQPADPR